MSDTTQTDPFAVNPAINLGRFAPAAGGAAPAGVFAGAQPAGGGAGGGIDDIGTTFTSHELLYLLSLNETEAGATTRQHLRLGDRAEEGTRLYAAGAATLAIRGLVRVEGEDLVPSQEVQALALMLTECDHWVELGMVSQTAADGALLVTGGPVALALMARELGMFTAAALEDSTLVGGVAQRVVRAFLDEHKPGAATFNVTAGGEKRQRLLHRNETGAWSHTDGVADEEGNLSWTDVSDGAVESLIGELVARPPAEPEAPMDPAGDVGPERAIDGEAPPAG